MLDAVLGAQALQPVRAPAAGGHHGVLGEDLELLAAVGKDDALADAVLEIRLRHSQPKSISTPLSMR
jgi:hypothetical protein